MSTNKKQALRSKTRPSNSAKAASLLNGGAGAGFIGFGSGGFSRSLDAVSGIASSAAEECVRSLEFSPSFSTFHLC
jgi:hypothetical protein